MSDPSDYDEPDYDEAYRDCDKCGREYRAIGTCHRAGRESPPWFEVDPDSRICARCIEEEDMAREEVDA